MAFANPYGGNYGAKSDAIEKGAEKGYEQGKKAQAEDQEVGLPEVGGGMNTTQETEDRDDVRKNMRTAFFKKMGY